MPNISETCSCGSTCSVDDANGGNARLAVNVWRKHHPCPNRGVSAPSDEGPDYLSLYQARFPEDISDQEMLG